MKISYRKLAPVESKQYRELRLESLKFYPESFESSYQDQSHLSKLMFEKSIEQQAIDKFVVGAYDQEALVGICGFVQNSNYDLNNTGNIIQMYVRAEYGGRKIGLGLVKAATDEAFKIPEVEQIVLEVKGKNVRANRVYEEAGFVIYHIESPELRADNAGLRRMIICRE